MKLIVSAVSALALASLLAGPGCSKTAESAQQPGSIPAPADQANVAYATEIKPIFDAACIKCHGAEKQKGELRLDSREGVIKGGEDGPIFTVGKSAESPLVNSIARVGDEEHWMPPIDKGKPLTREQVALVRAWIDQGAN